jgi:DNA-binding NarL/FixJ family response regulator
MDGPCFHRARAALERAHDENVPIEVEADKIDNALRIYAFLWAGFQRRWTNRQMQVIDLSLIGKSGREIAAQLEVTPSAVSQHLHAAGANLLVKATKYWQDELEKIYSELE